jgi:hypothetical protein
MHIDHNQFNSLTMSNKKHTNTISIFNKCKANQHVVNHTSNTHVNGLFSITAQLDDDLDYLTQDENKNSSNQTQNKHGDSSEEKSSDEDSTVLKHQETLTKETDNSDYEWVAETNDAHSPLIKSKQGHSTGPHKTPPVITPQTKNIKNTQMIITTLLKKSTTLPIWTKTTNSLPIKSISHLNWNPSGNSSCRSIKSSQIGSRN